MEDTLRQVRELLLAGGEITSEQAFQLADTGMEGLGDLMTVAREVRQAFRGNEVSLCAIVNAKSGQCSEDCRFCAQSLRYRTGVKSYPLIPGEKILEAAEVSAEEGAGFFCIVTSGRRANREELRKIMIALEQLREEGRVRPCASLGALDLPDLVRLREAGLVRYHHNLETSRSFYASVCTTHSYEERVRTVRWVKEAGLSACSGGIFGLGETLKQRVEMALTLRELEVDSIPLNFLNPIPGTPLDGMPCLDREEILKSVALFRLIHPGAEIRACAGREVHLGDDPGVLLQAGIDGILTGDYLTTKGTQPVKDREIIAAHGMKVKDGGVRQAP